MQFKEYKKIHALHKDECTGILEGQCYIQEKVDGANASIWLGDDGEIHYGSRTRNLFLAQDNFNGFGDWVREHLFLKGLFMHYPNIRLNGEWLVRHTIGYHEVSYKKFYCFDIEDENGVKLPMENVYDLCERYEIPTVKLFGQFVNPTLDQIKELAGNSVLGTKGEGVVIKNPMFINKFGDQQYGKYVTQDFKEDNAITFGGNNKQSETYCEMYYVNKFITMPRLEKILNKIQNMNSERLEMKHIPQVMSMTYHDVIVEEAWVIATEMAKSGKMFDFKEFNKLCTKKVRQMYQNYLEGTISVADQKHV